MSCPLIPPFSICQPCYDQEGGNVRMGAWSRSHNLPLDRKKSELNYNLQALSGH